MSSLRNWTQRLVGALALVALLVWVAGGPTRTASAAVTQAVNTTYDATVDGGNFCIHGSQVNCNQYAGKQYVWFSGNPTVLPAGKYFWAVLDPGGQPDPNDGNAKNLSAKCDPYTNREFQVVSVTTGKGGKTTTSSVLQLINGSTHDIDSSSAPGMIRVGVKPCTIAGGPDYFADTANPGGVYILAVCSLANAPNAKPSDCKYDAFKVKAPTFVPTATLSGFKYFDPDGNGILDSADSPLANWQVQVSTGGPISSGGTLVASTTTNSLGAWSVDIPLDGSTGTTAYTVCEVQQTGWTQTGPKDASTVQVSDGMTGTLPTVGLNGFCYVVTVPNNDITATQGLDFFNNDTTKPYCALGAPISGGIQVTVFDSESGLRSVQVTELVNATASWDGGQSISSANNPALPHSFNITPGDTGTHTVTALKIDSTLGSNLALSVTDRAGNVTLCDPVQMGVIRSAGQPLNQNVAGVQQADHLLHVYNGSLGVANLTVTINGTTFQLNGLAAGQQVTIDVASALQAGANTVTLTATGQPGGSANVLFGNI